ncbi:hypothetical protein ACLOJK_005515 [Asimina triloba]
MAASSRPFVGDRPTANRTRKKSTPRRFRTGCTGSANQSSLPLPIGKPTSLPAPMNCVTISDRSPQQRLQRKPIRSALIRQQGTSVTAISISAKTHLLRHLHKLRRVTIIRQKPISSTAAI